MKIAASSRLKTMLLHHVIFPKPYGDASKDFSASSDSIKHR
jgi:hypothetical protein